MGKNAKLKKMKRDRLRSITDRLLPLFTFWNNFQSDHGLKIDFDRWEREQEVGSNHVKYKLGTVNGLVRFTHTQIQILVIKNGQQGNGHMTDFFQFFETGAANFGFDLVIDETENPRFRLHLMAKRNYLPYKTNSVIKRFKNLSYVN